jgi:glycolate oxidase FAD binding subunit
VIEHNAGDLTAVVSAETPLGELQRLLAGSRQMFALDPPGEPSLGAVVASNATGPLRHRYGSARDLVLGITVELADGTVAKAGGKVIKNVAGYDLAKLFTGSLGTLGRIVSLSVRLHPLPPATATAIGRSADPAALARAALDLSHRPLELQSLDVRWHEGEGAILARVGRAEPVAPAGEIAAALSEHGLASEVLEDDDPAWQVQREWQRSTREMVRVSGLQTQLVDVLEAARRLDGRVVGRAGLGLSWIGVDGVEAAEELRRAFHGPIDPGARELMGRVKERFDPEGALAPLPW